MDVALLLAILASGFVDGFDLCSIGLLTLFLSVMFTLNRGRFEMLLTGAVYISASYITYFAIGLGILNIASGLTVLNVPHLLAIVGAWLMVFLGLMNVKDYFFPGLGPTLRLPDTVQRRAIAIIRRATMPSAAIGGALVGLHSFPCACTVVYPTVLGVLATYPFPKALPLLILYNFMVVSPLLAILLASSSKAVVRRVSRWRLEQGRRFRLWMGLAMIALGMAFLFLARFVV